MLCTLSNECLEVAVETRGAELRSLRGARGGLEYLWQGSHESWPDRGPLLFPLIGRLKGKSYSHGGKRYPMDIHGFARSMEFRPQRRGPTGHSFFLVDSPATREAWPFEFELELRYTLEGSRLRKEHILRNSGATELLYEIGGHEGYNVPLFPGESFKDYYVQFEGLDHLSTRCVDRELMITKESRIIPLDAGRLDLDLAIFEKDALILEETGARTATIGSSRHGERIRVSFPDFGYLGLWTMAGVKEARYLCIEPWSSLPDCDYLGEELALKEGVRRLGPGAAETLAYTMELGQAV